MDKIEILKNFKKILFELTIIGGIVVGDSIYNYFHIDDIYDSIKGNTSKQIMFDYQDYNKSNDIVLEDPITSYNNYLDYVATLYKDVLNLSDPNQIFMVYCYMKDNGYLSYNNKYSYGTPIIDIYGSKGINVALGNGVCEHETEFFNDILSRMGIENYKIVCSLNVDSNKDGINLKIEEEEDSLTGVTVSYYNQFNKLNELSIMPIFNVMASSENPTHAFSAVKYNDNVYYFDTTNMVKWDYVGDELWQCMPIETKISDDIQAFYSPVYTKMENDIGKLLNYECNNDLNICKNLYEELYNEHKYDMLFSRWNNSIPSELFEGMKTLKYFNKMRRNIYD